MTGRCEMFCDRPLGPGDESGDEDTKAMCKACREKLEFVCGEVLPAIRKFGYYAPPGTDVDDEFAAMTEQTESRPKFRDALDGVMPGLFDALNRFDEERS